jgi:DNA-binding transcriptional LysR family regulator
VALGTIWLIPLIKEFNSLYPDVNITLIVDDRELNLSMHEADVAIRLYESRQPDLIQKPLTTINSSLYASNDYLRLFGIPKTIEELVDHRIITYSDTYSSNMSSVGWLMSEAANQGVELSPYLTINNMYGILRAVKTGMGIAAMPDYMVQRARHVSKILDELQGPPIEAYLVYSTDMKNSRRVTAFRHFVERKLGEFVF